MPLEQDVLYPVGWVKRQHEFKLSRGDGGRERREKYFLEEDFSFLFFFAF